MAEKSGTILVIDDDPDVLTAAQLLLKRHYALVSADENPERIPDYLREQNWDVIMLDMNFAIGANSGTEGLQWLSRILELQPSALVILMTAYGAVDTAVKAIKQGAIDFVLKPWHNERLLTTVAAAMRLRASRQEVQHLKSREKELVSAAPGGMVGTSKVIRDLQDNIRRVAPTQANVLILGENGTGKEVVAREIYTQSRRADEVLITVDLGSVAETLFESELFGHKKGAFTGANVDRIGRFQAANGGTLFLDEIGNLPLHLQGKLLSALEQRQVLPLGSNTPVPIDIRLICATNKPLKQMVREGGFREDLLYRINTVELALAPLRERTEDLPQLLEHFIAQYARKYSLPTKTVAPEVLAQIAAYPWPGNIRELRHAVERAMIMSQGDRLLASDLLPVKDATSAPAANMPSINSDLNLEQVEKSVIETALRKHKGNISHAAKELGITRTSLYRRMEKYGL
ncbi:MAG: sigma-54 dependent transcriptional regulator [Pseudomonadota bacterium]